MLLSKLSTDKVPYQPQENTAQLNYVCVGD